MLIGNSWRDPEVVVYAVSDPQRPTIINLILPNKQIPGAQYLILDLAGVKG